MTNYPRMPFAKNNPGSSSCFLIAQTKHWTHFTLAASKSNKKQQHQQRKKKPHQNNSSSSNNTTAATATATTKYNLVHTLEILKSITRLSGLGVSGAVQGRLLSLGE
ncbi:hypothetical protein PoB_004722200 [Plakobranchus ocellatus]|uniref:Uncharacterized protein n=1 Tax=Plakobranchus ocellatus TaxID=259542 RepID=A0AAV4BP47_9GAST|nr:hypothetical protein PoB_004722200 [Plakobranchus ocellatus]